MTFFNNFFLLSLLFVAPWKAPTPCKAETNGPNFGFVVFKTVVRIFNNLDNGLNCTIHCKSKDDDLGIHVIPPEGFYGWKFRVNFVGTTLFFCGLQWEDGRGVFDVYKATRDLRRCPTKCVWRVYKEGLFGYREYDGKLDENFNWTRKDNKDFVHGHDG